MSEFSPAQIAAVAGVLPAKQVSNAKKSLAASVSAEIDVRLHLRALVSKSEPSTAKPTASLLSKASVAYLLSRAGATRASSEKALADLAALAIEAGGRPADKLIAEDDRLLLTLHELEEHVLSQLPRPTRDGRVSVRGSIEEVEAL